MDRSIRTLRLTLGAIRQEDRDELIRLFRDDTVKKTYMLPDLRDDREAEALFARMAELSEREDRYVFGIHLDGCLIGVLNDTEICGDYVEMGYALAPDYFNKGYATEAFSAVIGYLFDRGVPCVIAGAFSENLASIRVMEKCGMERLDRTENIDYRGKDHLCVYYSIKKEKESNEKA